MSMGQQFSHIAFNFTLESRVEQADPSEHCNPTNNERTLIQKKSQAGTL